MHRVARKVVFEDIHSILRCKRNLSARKNLQGNSTTMRIRWCKYMKRLELIDWNILLLRAESKIREQFLQVLLELGTLYLGVTISVNTCALRRRN